MDICSAFLHYYLIYYPCWVYQGNDREYFMLELCAIYLSELCEYVHDPLRIIIRKQWRSYDELPPRLTAMWRIHSRSQFLRRCHTLDVHDECIQHNYLPMNSSSNAVMSAPQAPVGIMLACSSSTSSAGTSSPNFLPVDHSVEAAYLSRRTFHCCGRRDALCHVLDICNKNICHRLGYPFDSNLHIKKKKSSCAVFLESLRSIINHCSFKHLEWF